MYKFHYDRNNFTSIIMVPYKGNTSMLIVLPDEGKMQELEKNINKDRLKYWCDRLSYSYVDLFMPKFSISSSFSLADTLREMGIVSAFSDTADFSGISEETQLKTSKVLHQAVLKVDEKGTDAAAATTVEIVLTSMPLTLKLNRPFLVFIVDHSTKSILFMGKITDPTA
ncbi:alpha-1-antitrypsin homolog [Colossoma macropomum]|uniref:alpha-1-antitrypsin homolog n=1 Tax=Colossoma macropomum TaxID=42526 RepID=UPI0018647284|nr:alpha-1-antitrypsin homolog [Colossoma macropomum]